jgi:hypothetical protein
MEAGAAGIKVGVSVPVEDAALVPHVPLSEITDTEPAPLPMVMVADVVPCPAVIDHPVPVTDQVYDAAPETAEMLNAFPVLLAQILAGCVIEPGALGTPKAVIDGVVLALLVPQAFPAVTETVPTPLPMLTVADVVPCPAVTDQPVPVTDHV